MRKHEKNIGKKVYLVCDGNTMGFSQYEIYEGILVCVEENKVKIFIEKLNKVVDVYKKFFNQTGNYKWGCFSWGYTDKNIYQFIKNRRRRYDKLYAYWQNYSKVTTSYFINKNYPEGKVPWDWLEIDTEDNKYLHRYKNELEKLFSFFSKERMFYVRKNTRENKYELETSIQFYITKYYEKGDKTKPNKVKIKFYHQDGHINIHKFDRFVRVVNLIEGEKYYGN